MLPAALSIRRPGCPSSQVAAGCPRRPGGWLLLASCCGPPKRPRRAQCPLGGIRRTHPPIGSCCFRRAPARAMGLQTLRAGRFLGRHLACFAARDIHARGAFDQALPVAAAAAPRLDGVAQLGFAQRQFLRVKHEVLEDADFQRQFRGRILRERVREALLQLTDRLHHRVHRLRVDLGANLRVGRGGGRGTARRRRLAGRLRGRAWRRASRRAWAAGAAWRACCSQLLLQFSELFETHSAQSIEKDKIVAASWKRLVTWGMRWRAGGGECPVWGAIEREILGCDAFRVFAVFVVA